MRAVHPTQAIYGNIPFGHNYDCVTFLWPRRLVWSSAHYNFCLSLLLSIPTIPSEQASERGEDTQSLRLGGGVAALYKEIRGYIDIGRLLLLRLLKLLPPLRHNERRPSASGGGARSPPRCSNRRTAAIRAAHAFPSVRPFPLGCHCQKMKIAVGQFEAAASSPLSMFWRHQKPPPPAAVSDWENWRENIAVTHRSWPEFHPGSSCRVCETDG